MSEYFGIVYTIKELKAHPNAEKLQILPLFGTQTIVSMQAKIGDTGIYFREGLQLSEEFCDFNHLCREDKNGNKDIGYMERNKRNVKTIKLRNEYSDGVWLPLSSLSFTGVDLSSFKDGDHIEMVNGKEICKKYVPFQRPSAPTVKQNGKTRKVSVPIAPDFKEHCDTQQLMYNLDQFHSGDLIEISLKMHGTSARTAHTRVLKGFKRSLLDRILHREGKPIYDWGYVSGTRRTVLENFDGGYYGDNRFREPAAKFFEGKLHKGEEIYMEIVGFTTTGAPIMPSAKNTDPEVIARYGDTMTFSYGCYPEGKKKMHGKDEKGHFMIEEDAPQNDFYVYRIMQTLEDGSVIELSGDQMRHRCEELNCKYVPLLAKFVIPNEAEINLLSMEGHDFENTPGGYVQWMAEHYYDGPDPIGKNHIREGVVVRIVDREGYVVYKMKNNTFKICANIAIDKVDAAEMSDDLIAEM